MKLKSLALLTDLHFGTHSDSSEFLDYQEKFFSEIFFPYLEKNKIKQIISLGDEFHHRKTINYSTFNEAKRFFFDRIENEGYKLTIIVGNHNLFYKNLIDVNSPKLLFDKYNSIEVIEKPTEISFDGVKFLLVPWISKANEVEVLEAINATDAEYLLGHFEIVGIKLHKNWEFSKGLEHGLLNKFKEVWSGHYHLQLKKDNFLYLGSAVQLDWSDAITPKYFYDFKLRSKELKFIENPLKIYGIIEYAEEIDLDSFNYVKYKNRYVKVILNESLKNFTKFDLFVKKLEEVAYNCSVVEKYLDKVSEKEASEEVEVEEKIESTLDTIKKKCDENSIVDKEKLFKYMKSIYVKSKTLEDK